MTLSPYLTFDGECAAAFDFYKNVFGGDFTMKSTFAEGPPDMGVPEGEKDRIMHVSLPVGDNVLMGSDTTSTHGGPLQVGNNFSISYSAPSREAADRVFAALSDGGETVMAMQDTFWNAYFGLCTDKFGVSWMVNFDLTGE